MTGHLIALNRRTMIGGTAAMVALFPAARLVAAEPGGNLETAFRGAFDAPANDPAALIRARLSFLAEEALAVDHDVPFPLDRAAYADHLGFRAANAERLEVKLQDIRARAQGGTGIASAFFIERSKPKNAGYRLRAGYCTAVCARDKGRWRAIGFHMGPLSGQLIDASPG